MRSAVDVLEPAELGHSQDEVERGELIGRVSHGSESRPRLAEERLRRHGEEAFADDEVDDAVTRR